MMQTMSCSIARSSLLVHGRFAGQIRFSYSFMPHVSSLWNDLPDRIVSCILSNVLLTFLHPPIYILSILMYKII